MGNPLKYNANHFQPNPGYLTYNLNKDTMDFLWARIDKAKEMDSVVNDRLAGNITKSLDMGLHDLGPIAEIVIPLCEEYVKQFSQPYHNQVAGECVNVISFSDWWVNYQYQNEFNPPHNHSGVYSWVIWMKIPTEFDDQKMLPIAEESTAKNHISNFAFSYVDTLGSINQLMIPMGKKVEGTLCLFPSQLKHSVNPFYNCDEPRISIAGNVSLYSKPTIDK
jgi:hypothetical protein